MPVEEHKLMLCHDYLGQLAPSVLHTHCPPPSPAPPPRQVGEDKRYLKSPLYLSTDIGFVLLQSRGVLGFVCWSTEECCFSSPSCRPRECVSAFRSELSNPGSILTALGAGTVECWVPLQCCLRRPDQRKVGNVRDRPNVEDKENTFNSRCVHEHVVFP